VLKFQMKWWTNSRISFSHRLSYSLSCVFQLPWRGTVSYFGKPFSSDNPLALLLLPEYANLLSKIDQKTDSITGKNLRILDIGANVGQFAATAQRLLSATVTSVEPNPICWPYLKKNGAGTHDWQVIRRAVSSHPSKMTLYYVDGKSAQGSFSKFNAGNNLISGGQEMAVKVETGPITHSVLGQDSSSTMEFDLVKIDVEGFELEALRGLKEVTFRYLLIELEPSRDNGFSENDVHSLVNDELGLQLRKIFSDRRDDGSGPQNILFEVLPLTIRNDLQ